MEVRLFFVAALMIFSAPTAFAGSAAAIEVTIQRKEIIGCVQTRGACLKDALAVPYSSGGKVTGWKLKQIKKDSLFAKLKFRDGDVILTANGETLTDPSRSLYWMMQIVTVKSVDLEILRGGRPMKISCQIKD